MIEFIYRRSPTPLDAELEELARTCYYEALGVMISKLAYRLKFRKSYSYLAKTSEMKLAEKLKNL